MAGAIAFALRQSETGTRVEEICRQLGVSQATFFNWNRGGGPQKVRRHGRCRTAKAASVGGG
uniref:transposase n=1 Tax=Dyadobacter beijingensis TaxID=365489 RepID=UPI0035B60EA8